MEKPSLHTQINKWVDFKYIQVALNMATNTSQENDNDCFSLGMSDSR